MDPNDHEELIAKVEQVAAAVLQAQGYVSAIDVLIGLGWLARARVEDWRQKRLPVLEAGIPTNPSRVSQAIAHLPVWATSMNLLPSETGYVAGRQRLRFSRSGSPELEKAYRTHWVSPKLLGRPAG